MRRRLPRGVRMYTGDDFNYAELIGGDAHGHSDALLGIFDAIAPAASAALTALAAGDRARFDAILAPTVPLSRHIFAAPTRFYKTGVVFLAWLNGHQSHFTMVGGQQSARSVAASRAAVPARRRRRAAARSRARLPRACARCSRCTASKTDADERAATPSCCRSTPRRCARNGRLPRSSTAARGTASAASRRGATRSPRPGSRRAPQRIRDAGLAVSGYCRGGMFPALDRAGDAARRSTTTGARSTRR